MVAASGYTPADIAEVHVNPAQPEPLPVTGGLATWQVPTLLLQARFVKVSAQFEW